MESLPFSKGHGDPRWFKMEGIGFVFLKSTGFQEVTLIYRAGGGGERILHYGTRMGHPSWEAANETATMQVTMWH